MASLSQVQAGIDFVEAHLDEEFTLGQVAAAAGMSQWHFQRVFKALTRETLKTYIRSRRLAGALTRLLETDMRIIEVAMVAGFESQESFTRAFRQAFDMTPAQYRRLGKRNQFLRKVQLTPEYLESMGASTGVLPQLSTFEEMTLVGLCTEYFGEGSEKNNVAGKLPALWDAFIPRMAEISGHRPGIGYGVIAQTLDEDRLMYTAAGVLDSEAARASGWTGTSPASLPEGMCMLHVPARKYAIFEHRGVVKALDHTVSYAYSNWLLSSGWRHTGDPDLEIYGPQFHPSSADSVIHYALPITES